MCAVTRCLNSAPEPPQELGVGPGHTLFDRAQFKNWETVTGRNVTWDTGCNTETAYMDPDSSPQHVPFLRADVRGHHIWMSPRPNKLASFLER